MRPRGVSRGSIRPGRPSRGRGSRSRRRSSARPRHALLRSGPLARVRSAARAQELRSEGGRGAAGYAPPTLSDRNLRAGIAALALAGAGVAAYLSYTRLAHAQILCTSGGCETVQRSRYSKLAGIPVAYLGVASYAVLLATAASPREAAAAVGAVVALAAAVFAGYLIVVQVAVIHAICAWCIASDTITVAIAALAVPRLTRTLE